MTIKIKGRTRYSDDALATITIEDQWRQTTLFKIKGGSIDFQRRDLGTFRIECQHLTDTDVEHDAAKVAYFEGAGLNFDSVFMRSVHFTGVIMTTEYYPDGPPTDTERCEADWCNNEHGFMDFTPPKQKFTPQLCHITVDFSKRRKSR